MMIQMKLLELWDGKVNYDPNSDNFIYRYCQLIYKKDSLIIFLIEMVNLNSL